MPLIELSPSLFPTLSKMMLVRAPSTMIEPQDLFVGNLAGPLNLTLHVELMDVKDYLSGNIISLPRQQ
jgi:hypothetical protein